MIDRRDGPVTEFWICLAKFSGVDKINISDVRDVRRSTSWIKQQTAFSMGLVA